MFTKVSRLGAILIGFGLAACGDASSENVKVERQAAQSIPDSGFVPYPLLVNPNNQQPILGPNGTYQPAWDGSLADLIAADGYAMCSLSTAFSRTYPNHTRAGGWDRYLDYLLAKMGEVECRSLPGVVYTEDIWFLNRTSAVCNVDPRTNNLARIESLDRDAFGYDSFYEVNATWGLNGSTNVIEAARQQAGRELEYADLNLCIAQYMRSQLHSGQSLFTTSPDLTEILGVIRERAQLASVYYGLISKIMSWQGEDEPDTITASVNDWMILIRHWAMNVASSAELQRIGEDFATSVRLLNDTTHELAALLERTASQRPVGAGGFSRPQRDWGVGQPRVRLMNLLYGGDPIGDPNLFYGKGRGVGGASLKDGGAAPFVAADMRDPRIGTLLGLARHADAVRMKLALDDFGAVTGFDAEASAERLYRSVELTLRVEQCELDPLADCDPEEIEANLPPIEDFPEYLLWTVHAIEPSTARVFTQGFAEAFGDLVTFQNQQFYGLWDGLMHLTGQHALESFEGEDWLHVDDDFDVQPYRGHQLALDYARRPYLPERLVLHAEPYVQGFAVQAETFMWWDRLREIGTVPALAFVREALVDGSLAPAPAQGMFQAAGVVLPEIEAQIGPRSVGVRAELEAVDWSCFGGVFEPGAVCETLFSTGNFRLSSVTETSDPLDSLTVAPRSPQLHTVAVDADTVAFDGVDRAALDGYPRVSPDVTAYSGYAEGREKRLFEYQRQDPDNLDLLLGGALPGGGSSERVYMSIWAAQVFPSNTVFATFGGELHSIAERVMAVLPHDWSRPAFDSFGLPVDWVPPADASLVGGQPGEQSYTYYLSVAKQAAQEATAAVQVAIDNLISETQDEVELEVAEERAETIASIETTSLCGQTQNCNVAQQIWNRSTLDCTVDDRGLAMGSMAQGFCNLAVELRNRITPPQFQTAQVALTAATPSFSEFSGSEMQRILVRQWNAIRQLRLTDSAFLSSARAMGTQIESSRAALTAAEADRDAARASLDAEIAALDTTNAEIAALVAELVANEANLDAQLNLTWLAQERSCSDEAFQQAGKSGFSYSAVRGARFNRNGNLWEFSDHDDKSWSPGALYAQVKMCQDAVDRHNAALASYDEAKAALLAQYQAALARGELTVEQGQALVRQRAAADAKYDAAVAAQIASERAHWSQVTASLSQLQNAIISVVDSQVEFNQLHTRLQAVTAQANLERDLAQKQADARFGIRRKFRSYDMWRARALLESARKLAVAARRAIESNFVVDLSELQASQAFVESPALWADEIYGSDLDAPSVVGLSAAPRIENAVFPNKLIDYVENLERFVQGYTISYPTALAEPDTEVLTLPGPDLAVSVEEEDDETTEIVAAGSLGWKFHCADTGAWLPHPGVGQIPVEDTLETLCDGAAPDRMRLGFSLDPWGRLGGAIALDPLEQRHNVRWRRLAVNLVGTGIRDCKFAPDPVECYSEPFLRFDLRHVGPAWTTNHSREWRAFNVAAALIEGGKALTAEEWLDPLTNSWNTPLVSNAARSELFGRSMGGAYELEIELGPEVRLDRIERVQLLAQMQYWVRQE